MTQKYKTGAGAYNRQLFWSAESHLDSAMKDSYGMVRYDYNALGKPVVKYRKFSGGGWAVDSYFIWDGDQLLLDLDGSGNRRADYVYYPGTIDQPAAETIGATSVTAIRDHRLDAEWEYQAYLKLSAGNDSRRSEIKDRVQIISAMVPRTDARRYRGVMQSIMCGHKSKRPSSLRGVLLLTLTIYSIYSSAAAPTEPTPLEPPSWQELPALDPRCTRRTPASAHACHLGK